MYTSLVLSGGGVKGYTLIGIIKFLQEKNILNFRYYSGTSIGSIFCFLLILGFTADEIERILINFPLSNVKHFSLNYVYKNQWGVNSIEKLILILRILCKYKGVSENITFKELMKITQVDDFNVIATKLPNFEEIVFNKVNTPDIKVIDAIRCSINIPFVFTKTNVDGDYYIDGGFVNNFPIEHSIGKTLGVVLKSIAVNEKYKIDTFIDYITCLLKGIYKKYGEFQRQKIEQFSKTKDIITVKIDGGGAIFLNFNLQRKDKEYLIKLGYDAIANSGLID